MISKKLFTVVQYRGKTLTSRQLQILELIGMGYSNKDISKNLYLSTKTVESHIAKIRRIMAMDHEDKISDRKLVLMAKEMLDGYYNFLRA